MRIDHRREILGDRNSFRIVQDRKRWRKIDADWSFFELDWKPRKWPARVRCVVYRQRVAVPRKGPIQLDLFEPIERDFEYKVVATNKSTTRTSVYEVMTKPALTLDSDMNTKYAIRLLSRLHLTRALVIHGKELLGLVTLRDMVLGFVGSEEPAPHGKE